MKCRNCGTEIADKALICYRCGTATTEAKYQPHVAKPRRSRWVLIAVVIVALLVLLALFLLNSANASPARASTSIHEPEPVASAPPRLVDSGNRVDLYRIAA